MNVGRRKKHVNTRTHCGFKRLSGALDVVPRGPSKRRDNRSWHCGGHRLDSGEISVRSDGKSGFDHVDSKAV
jgi:hypothetical protein